MDRFARRVKTVPGQPASYGAVNRDMVQRDQRMADSAADRSADIGELLARFARNSTQVKAGFVVAGLFALFGLLIPIVMVFSSPARGVVVAGLMWTAILLVLAAVVTIYLRRVMATVVDIHAEGFVVRRGGHETVFRWDQLQEVWEHVRVQRGKVRRFPADPTINCQEFIALRKDGSKFTFNRVSIGRYRECRDLIQSELKSHGVPWVHQEVLPPD